ncbi:hypothetical protein HK104_007521 [Borealophlyctis nickersoniae]|nr:hypothetical protein HK104_007521 [Borealophlyctis nickersoniae]
MPSPPASPHVPRSRYFNSTSCAPSSIAACLIVSGKDAYFPPARVDGWTQSDPILQADATTSTDFIISQQPSPTSPPTIGTTAITHEQPCPSSSDPGLQSHLEHQLSISRAHIKKLESQVRILTRKKEALHECVEVLKKDVWREREGRAMVEKHFGERIKKMELELDFKENEIEDLRRERSSSKSYSSSSNPLLHCSSDSDDDMFSPSNLPPIIGRGEAAPEDDDDEDEDEADEDDRNSDSDAPDVPSSTSTTTPKTSHVSTPFHVEGVNRLYQELVSDVTPSTMAVDLDVLAGRFGAGSCECLVVVVEAVLKFLEVKGLLGSGEEVVKRFCTTSPTRIPHHTRILMSLYKLDLVEPPYFLQWYESCTDKGGPAKVIREQARTFVEWVSSVDASDSDGNNSTDPVTSDEDGDDEDEDPDDDDEEGEEEEETPPRSPPAGTISPNQRKHVTFAGEGVG